MTLNSVSVHRERATSWSPFRMLPQTSLHTRAVVLPCGSGSPLLGQLLELPPVPLLKHIPSHVSRKPSGECPQCGCICRKISKCPPGISTVLCRPGAPREPLWLRRAQSISDSSRMPRNCPCHPAKAGRRVTSSLSILRFSATAQSPGSTIAEKRGTTWLSWAPRSVSKCLLSPHRPKKYSCFSARRD